MNYLVKVYLKSYSIDIKNCSKKKEKLMLILKDNCDQSK